MSTKKLLLLTLLFLSMKGGVFAFDLQEPFSMVNQSIVLNSASATAMSLFIDENKLLVESFTLLPVIPLYEKLPIEALYYHGFQLGLITASIPYFFFECKSDFISLTITDLLLSSVNFAPCYIDAVLKEDKDWFFIVDYFTYPFQWEAYESQPLNIILGSLSCLYMGLSYFIGDTYQEDKGLFFQDTYENILLSLSAGCFEEALYTDLIYENLKNDLDPISANILSSVFFGLNHIPNDILVTDSLGELFLGVLLKTGTHICSNAFIYDKYGMVPAVTFHFLWDLLLWTIEDYSDKPVDTDNTSEESDLFPVQFDMNVAGDLISVGLRCRF